MRGVEFGHCIQELRINTLFPPSGILPDLGQQWRQEAFQVLNSNISEIYYNHSKYERYFIANKSLHNICIVLYCALYNNDTI